MTDDLTQIKGIGPSVAALLDAHGLRTISAIAEASAATLCEVRGFGPRRAAAVREAAALVLQSRPPASPIPEQPDAENRSQETSKRKEKSKMKAKKKAEKKKAMKKMKKALKKSERKKAEKKAEKKKALKKAAKKKAAKKAKKKA